MLSIIALHLSTAGVYFAAYLTEKLQQCNYFFILSLSALTAIFQVNLG